MYGLFVGHGDSVCTMRWELHMSLGLRWKKMVMKKKWLNSGCVSMGYALSIFKLILIGIENGSRHGPMIISLKILREYG